MAVAISRVILLTVESACVAPADDGDPVLDTGKGPTAPPPPILDDGLGEGTFRLPLFGDRFSLLVGAPSASVDGAARVGLASVLASEPGQGLVTNPQYHASIIEGASSVLCESPTHRFAWQHAANRSFGRAFAWYSENLGADYLDYLNIPVISAPRAEDSNGMIAQYRDCLSCASFASSPGSLVPTGDEIGTAYGASLGVGVFEFANIESAHLWRLNSSESLAIGAPFWNGSGGVHVYDVSSYRLWLSSYGDGVLTGEQICDRSVETGALRPRLRTLAGGFPTEEFGRSMVVADFSCDGYDDLAVGAPGADLAIGNGQLIEDAGAVYVFRGGPMGIGIEGSLVLTQGMFGSEGTPEAGDRFGEVLTVGNFNGRRVDAEVPWSCWDLAIGTPNEDGSRGEVQIFYGDPSSLAVLGPILRPGEDGLPGARAPGDRFGAALVGYAFDNGGFHDLAIGAPGHGGGQVHLVPGSNMGLSTPLGNFFEQQTLVVPDDDDPNDEFGRAVGAMQIERDKAMVIGVPGEDMGQGSIVLVKIELDLASGALVASEPATIIGPAEAGLSATTDVHWGEIIAAPRAFPTQPAEFS
ncbi:hypothetical protein [Paraliomyxa miuraensis]|uniref:hypothetical protein n=1 Tax=Paraliomyxa miuraensis TaxID=376150 RepID=UPI00224EA3AA|nr:hypothetical protein [Paraliomyxa miuraensis]MCX4248035.1 integrin alpha [Paraliomyxa miuraensis]